MPQLLLTIFRSCTHRRLPLRKAHPPVTFQHMPRLPLYLQILLTLHHRTLLFHNLRRLYKATQAHHIIPWLHMDSHHRRFLLEPTSNNKARPTCKTLVRSTATNSRPPFKQALHTLTALVQCTTNYSLNNNPSLAGKILPSILHILPTSIPLKTRLLRPPNL